MRRDGTAGILRHSGAVRRIGSLRHRVGNALRQAICRLALPVPEREGRHAIGEGHVTIDAIDAPIAQGHREGERLLRIRPDAFNGLGNGQRAQHIIAEGHLHRVVAGNVALNGADLRPVAERIEGGLRDGVDGMLGQVRDFDRPAVTQLEGRHAIGEGHRAEGAVELAVQRDPEAEHIIRPGRIALHHLADAQSAQTARVVEGHAAGLIRPDGAGSGAGGHRAVEVRMRILDNGIGEARRQRGRPERLAMLEVHMRHAVDELEVAQMGIEGLTEGDGEAEGALAVALHGAGGGLRELQLTRTAEVVEGRHRAVAAAQLARDGVVIVAYAVDLDIVDIRVNVQLFHRVLRAVRQAGEDQVLAILQGEGRLAVHEGQAAVGIGQRLPIVGQRQFECELLRAVDHRAGNVLADLQSGELLVRVLHDGGRIADRAGAFAHDAHRVGAHGRFAELLVHRVADAGGQAGDPGRLAVPEVHRGLAAREGRIAVLAVDVGRIDQLDGELERLAVVIAVDHVFLDVQLARAAGVDEMCRAGAADGDGTALHGLILVEAVGGLFPDLVSRTRRQIGDGDLLAVGELHMGHAVLEDDRAIRAVDVGAIGQADAEGEQPLFVHRGRALVRHGLADAQAAHRRVLEHHGLGHLLHGGAGVGVVVRVVTLRGGLRHGVVDIGGQVDSPEALAGLQGEGRHAIAEGHVALLAVDGPVIQRDGEVEGHIRALAGLVMHRLADDDTGVLRDAVHEFEGEGQLIRVAVVGADVGVAGHADAGRVALIGAPEDLHGGDPVEDDPDGLHDPGLRCTGNAGGLAGGFDRHHHAVAGLVHREALGIVAVRLVDPEGVRPRLIEGDAAGEGDLAVALTGAGGDLLAVAVGHDEGEVPADRAAGNGLVALDGHAVADLDLILLADDHVAIAQDAAAVGAGAVAGHKDKTLGQRLVDIAPAGIASQASDVLRSDALVHAHVRRGDRTAVHRAGPHGLAAAQHTAADSGVQRTEIILEIVARAHEDRVVGRIDAVLALGGLIAGEVRALGIVAIQGDGIIRNVQRMSVDTTGGAARQTTAEAAGTVRRRDHGQHAERGVVRRKDAAATPMVRGLRPVVGDVDGFSGRAGDGAAAVEVDGHAAALVDARHVTRDGSAAEGEHAAIPEHGADAATASRLVVRHLTVRHQEAAADQHAAAASLVAGGSRRAHDVRRAPVVGHQTAVHQRLAVVADIDGAAAVTALTGRLVAREDRAVVDVQFDLALGRQRTAVGAAVAREHDFLHPITADIDGDLAAVAVGIDRAAHAIAGRAVIEIAAGEVQRRAAVDFDHAAIGVGEGAAPDIQDGVAAGDLKQRGIGTVAAPHAAHVVHVDRVLIAELHGGDAIHPHHAPGFVIGQHAVLQAGGQRNARAVGGVAVTGRLLPEHPLPGHPRLRIGHGQLTPVDGEHRTQILRPGQLMAVQVDHNVRRPADADRLRQLDIVRQHDGPFRLPDQGHQLFQGGSVLRPGSHRHEHDCQQHQDKDPETALPHNRL